MQYSPSKPTDFKRKTFLEWLYGDCSVCKLQDFSREHKRYRTDRTTKTNLLRYALIAANTSIMLLTLTMYGPQNFFKYLTNWTLLLCTYSIYLSAEAAENLLFNEEPTGQRRHHFFYSLSFLMNFVVTSIFWTLLNPNTVIVYKGQTMILVEQWLVHSVPAISCVINTYMTNCVLSRTLLRPLQFIGVVYLAINFCQTKALGEPVYKFLHWEDTSSLVLVGGLLLGFSLIYIAFCKMDEVLKYETLLRKIKKRKCRSRRCKKRSTKPIAN